MRACAASGSVQLGSRRKGACRVVPCVQPPLLSRPQGSGVRQEEPERAEDCAWGVYRCGRQVYRPRIGKGRASGRVPFFRAGYAGCIAKALDVAPACFDTYGIEHYDELMHALFLSEEAFSIKPCADGSIRFTDETIQSCVCTWWSWKEFLKEGKITREEYENRKDSFLR